MSAAYFAPMDLGEALDLLRNRTMSVVAGGTDFFPSRGRRPVKTDLLDITNIPGLRGIACQADGALRIGGATTWTDIARADLPAAFAGLRAAARVVGGVQIQNAGTVAGNLCNASPAADGVPPFLTLDAEVELQSANSSRRILLSDFLRGPRHTDLAQDELLTALYIPDPPDHACAAFEKAGARKFLVISIAMTAVLIGLDGAGKIDLARVAVGSCAPVAQRLAALETDLIGCMPEHIDVTPDHLLPLSPIADVRADETYRLDAVPHQIQRAIRAAVTAHG